MTYYGGTSVPGGKPSYVYRAYDKANNLLYVGCSANPDKRMKQHRSESREWIPYVSHVEVVGPFPRRQAFEIEDEAINTESPYFNCTSEQKHAIMANWHEATRLAFERGHVKWRDCPIAGRTGCGIGIEDFYEALESIKAELRETTHPHDDRSTRLARYLAETAEAAA